jgi:hypothetical protein
VNAIEGNATVTRVWFCLLVFSAVAAVSIGCGRKSATRTEWSNEGDPKPLIDLLKATKPVGNLDPRIVAAQRLGAMGPAAKDALPHLEKLTKDKNPNLAKAAQEAIAKIKQ